MEIQLTIAINFVSSKGIDEERVMIGRVLRKIMNHNNVGEVIEEIFESIISSYQIGLQKSRKCYDFTFDCLNLLYYKSDKINLNYITINPVNDDDKCFQHTATVSINLEEIGRNSRGISKIKDFYE